MIDAEKNTNSIPAKQGQRRLFLMRHARAAWPGPGETDFERQLDETGWREARQMAAKLNAIGMQPAKIICSPAFRCVETLKAIQDALPDTVQIRFERALYEGDTSTYEKEIEGHAPQDDLLIVGHNPVIEDLLIAYAGDSAPEIYGFPTAGIAAFTFLGKTDDGHEWQFDGLLQPD